MAVEDLSNEPLPSMAPRIAESHKGDYGKVLIIGGSCGMAGAPALTGMTALRSGVGFGFPCHSQVHPVDRGQLRTFLHDDRPRASR